MPRKRLRNDRPSPPPPTDPWQDLVTQERQANRQVLRVLWALVILGGLVFTFLWAHYGRP